MKYVMDAEMKTRPEPNLIKWARWFETADRGIASTTLDGRWVSTVFLGIGQQVGQCPPCLFETLVFYNDKDAIDNYSRSYETAREALLGHIEIVNMLLKSEER